MKVTILRVFLSMTPVQTATSEDDTTQCSALLSESMSNFANTEDKANPSVWRKLLLAVKYFQCFRFSLKHWKYATANSYILNRITSTRHLYKNSKTMH
jgi:hypothetical protein